MAFTDEELKAFKDWAHHIGDLNVFFGCTGANVRELVMRLEAAENFVRACAETQTFPEAIERGTAYQKWREKTGK